MVQSLQTQEKRELSVMERINQKETIYICYNFELQKQFGTASLAQALKFCRLNDCKYSTYPPKTYTED